MSEAVYTDAFIKTCFKPIARRGDRAAGITFRIQDKDNYYIVRANALENNVNIYEFVHQRRIFITGTRASVSSNTWQQLGVDVTGSRIRTYLNTHPLVQTTDGTFTAGKVGLWMKSGFNHLFR